MAGAIPEDFDELLRYLDELAAEPSPEEAPYASRYRVIEILQKLLSTDVPPHEEAVAHVILGTMYLQTEEPHNAQPALEKAATYMCPEFISYVATHTDADEPDHVAHDSIAMIQNEMPVVRVQQPEVQRYASRAVALLNQLGVLWCDRARPLRAALYLHAAAEYATYLKQHTDSDEILQEVQLLWTHTQFYLAQTYGLLGLPEHSAHYCLATLEAQLTAAISSGGNFSITGPEQSHFSAYRGAREWISNCLRLVEYFLEAERLEDAATALLACEYMLENHWQRPPVSGDNGENNASNPPEEDDERTEKQAEILGAWASLQHLCLQLAQWQREGIAPSSENSKTPNLTCEKLKQTLESQSFSLSNYGMQLVLPVSIDSFEQAREVFKMGVSASDRAKAYFVLDGFVTQHIRLCQRQSSLYKRLVYFEHDPKRIIAMQLRRWSLLNPFLPELNRNAYRAQLQEIYFECAEICTDIYELKWEKAQQTSKGEDKAIAYALKAVHCYQHYLALFYASSDPLAKTPDPAHQWTSMTASLASVDLPSKDMAPNEFKTFLMGLFALARICGRLVFPVSQKDQTVAFWKKSLEYHELVLRLTLAYQQTTSSTKYYQEFEAMFAGELALCQEMVNLLPEKINLLVYNNKLL